MKKIILLILPVLFLVVSCEDKQGKDCAGVEGGIASEDDCGMCTGGTTGVVANSSKDCAGVCDGTASQEDCDNCDSGTFDCSGTCDGSDVVDCEGVCGGSAVCGDDGGEELYSFNLNINDESGESISGVEFWVRYVPIWLENDTTLNKENTSRAVTSISFEIPVLSWNNLSIFNLEEELVETIVDTFLQPGWHLVQYNCSPCDTSYKAGVKVFKYKLTSTDSPSGAVLFEDYKYMVLINGAIDINLLERAGITDENGHFESNDKLWFPTLYQLPEIKRTDEVGNYLGNFPLTYFVSDTVEIRVKRYSDLYIFKYFIVDAANEINITLQNPLQKYIIESDIQLIPEVIIHYPAIKSFRGPDVDFLPNEFNLYQNYPNPYN